MLPVIDDDVRAKEAERRRGALKYATHAAKEKLKRGDALSTCLSCVFIVFSAAGSKQCCNKSSHANV